MFFVAKITTFKIYETHFIHIKTLEGSEVEKKENLSKTRRHKVNVYISKVKKKNPHAFEIAWICIIKCWNKIIFVKTAMVITLKDGRKSLSISSKNIWPQK